MAVSAKVCVRCEELVPATRFPTNKRMRDGLDSWCLDCRRVYARSLSWKRKGLPEPADLLRRRVTIERDEQGVVVRRECADCGLIKPVSEFGKNRTSTTGVSTYCRPCRGVRNERGRLMRQYGITEGGLADLRERQLDRCALCGDAAPGHLDHDHATGRGRALLCQRCNHGLGLFRERTELLRAAADYLEAHRRAT